MTLSQIQNVNGEHLKEILLVLFGLLSIATPFIIYVMAKRNKDTGLKCGAPYCEAMPKAECEAQHANLDHRLDRIEKQFDTIQGRIDSLYNAIGELPMKVAKLMKQE